MSFIFALLVPGLLDALIAFGGGLTTFIGDLFAMFAGTGTGV